MNKNLKEEKTTHKVDPEPELESDITINKDSFDYDLNNIKIDTTFLNIVLNTFKNILETPKSFIFLLLIMSLFSFVLAKINSNTLYIVTIMFFNIFVLTITMSTIPFVVLENYKNKIKIKSEFFDDFKSLKEIIELKMTLGESKIKQIQQKVNLLLNYKMGILYNLQKFILNKNYIKFGILIVSIYFIISLFINNDKNLLVAHVDEININISLFSQVFIVFNLIFTLWYGILWPIFYKSFLSGMNDVFIYLLLFKIDTKLYTKNNILRENYLYINEKYYHYNVFNSVFILTIMMFCYYYFINLPNFGLISFIVSIFLSFYTIVFKITLFKFFDKNVGFKESFLLKQINDVNNIN